MLAFALILALSAHTSLAKPTNYCIYPCDGQTSAGYQNGRYEQPSGFGQTGSGFGQIGSGFGQTSSGFGQTSSGFGQTGSNFGHYFDKVFSGMQGMSGGGMTHGKLEDFSTVGVHPGYDNRPATMPRYGPVHPGQSQRVESQVPVRPDIQGFITHNSGRASYEMNSGVMSIRQPGATQTVISEPIRQHNPCQNYYTDPCL